MAEVIQFAQFQVEQDAEGRPLELGRGGMGVTYKAFDTRLRRPVVLKVIRDGLLNDDTASKRFLREARSAARIQHPNIATVFDQGQQEDTFFYAMEYIEGETLQSLIKREGTLQPRLALEIILQVTKALQAAWAEKVIHRDIKPANIMLAKDKHGGDDIHVKLIDFGLAKGAVSSNANDADGGITVTADGGLTAGFVGTPHFASPEQIEPTGEIDIRSDIYSLGVTLWYALHGSPPFGGSSFVRVAAQHLSKPPPFSELKDAPAPVIALLKRMLAKDRDERPNDPTELRREIEGAIRALDSGAAAVSTLAAAATVQGPAYSGSGAPSSYSTPPPSVPNLPPPPVARPAWPPAVGAVVAGRYQIYEALGEDLTGKLFKAGDLQQGMRPVALRAVRAGLMETPAAQEAFQRGASLIAQLNHPGLIGGVSLLQTEGGRVATMEWLESRTLLDLLRARGGSISPAEVGEIIAQLGSACEAAASVGLEGLDLALGQVAIHLPAGAPPQGWPALLAQPLSQWPAWQVKVDALEFSENQAPPPMPCPEAGMMTIVPGQVSLKDLGKPLGQRYVERLGALAYEMLGGAPHRLDPDRLAAGGYTSVSAVGEEGNAVLKRALRPGPMESIVSPAQFAAAFAAALPRRPGAPASVPPPMAPPPAYAPPQPAYQAPPSQPAYQAPPPAAPPPYQPQVPTYSAPPAQPPPGQFVYAQPGQPVAPATAGGSKGGPNLGLLAGVGGGVLVLGAVAFFALKPGPKPVVDNPSPTPTPSSGLVANVPTPTPVKSGPRPSMSADDQRATEGMADGPTAAYLAVRKTETNPSRAWVKVSDDYKLGSRPLEQFKTAERAVALDSNSAPAQEALAYAALVLGKFDESERAAQRATVIDPRQAASWRTLGVNSYIRLKFQDANEQLGRAVSIAASAPASAANYHVWGDAINYQARVAGSVDEARRLVTQGVELMQKATSAYPQNADLWRALGRLLSDSGQADRAQEAFERALRVSPDYAEALNDRANAYSNARQFARAIDFYQRALKVSSEYPIIWSNLGSAYAASKDYANAIEAYQRALKGSPNFAFGLEGLADAFVRNFMAARAVEPAKNATNLLPNYPGAWKTLCFAYRRLGESQKAIEAGQRAVQLAPAYAEAHEMLGAAYAWAGQADKGIPILQKAIELDPNSASAHTQLGFAYYRAKQTDRAFASYTKATEIDAEAYEAWNLLGDYHRDAKRLQPAVEAYQKAVRVNPKFYFGWNDLGLAYSDMNQDAQAIEAYNKALALNPTLVAAFANLGFTYNRQQQYDKAVDALQKATRYDPKQAVAWNNLGYAYDKLNRTSEAIAAFEKAVEIRPSLTVSWNDLARLYEKTGQFDKARNARQRATAGTSAPPPSSGSGKKDNEFEEMLKTLERIGK
ncbi:MAG: tetratricopeptide repeat protein [Verrucomicrobia bacterium]|nr:tetratricopeptide repeat protein [Verrucomicrobiota bacterium]